MLASLLAGALIGYSAMSLSQAGLDSERVAHILVLGSLGGIASRVLTGWLAQRSALRSWSTVSVMMLVGALGTLGLASHEAAVAVAGCLTAFALGWEWSGLTFALMLVASGGHPGSSGASLQAGGMVGSAAGPVVMAVAVQAGGTGFGWCVMGAAIASAGLLVAPRRSGTRRQILY
jgi:predicted MFS family arabinose efflux permease